MKLIILGLLFGLLLFGCTAPESEATDEATPIETQEPVADEEPASEAVPSETDEHADEAEEHEVDPGEGTVIDVGESIPVTGDTQSMISESELSAHTMRESCWVLYHGQVYDVTGYLIHHPGGSSTIDPYCGLTDNSFADAFEAKHGLDYAEMLVSKSVLVGNYEG